MTILIGFVTLLVFALSVKGFFVLEQTYACEPKVRKGLERFFESVARGTFEELQKDVLFENQQGFQKLKSDVTKNFSVKIMDWWYGMEAVAVVRFDGGGSYGILLRPENDILPVCLGKYSAVTVRE